MKYFNCFGPLFCNYEYIWDITYIPNRGIFIVHPRKRYKQWWQRLDRSSKPDEDGEPGCENNSYYFILWSSSSIHVANSFLGDPVLLFCFHTSTNSSSLKRPQPSDPEPQIILIHSLTTNFLKVHLNIFRSLSRSSKQELFRWFPHQNSDSHLVCLSEAQAQLISHLYFNIQTVQREL